VGILASLSVEQVNVKGRKISVISGRTFVKPFAYFDHDTRSLRMWGATGLWGSQQFCGTVPKTGSMSGGVLCELPTLAHHTSEKDFSLLLPTPTGQNGKNKDSASQAARKSPPITSVTTHFPFVDGVWSGTWGIYAEIIEMWEKITRAAPEPAEIGDDGKPKLSSAFSEWMMGLPPGWVSEAPIPYTAQLKMLGNGVVPQQAELALRQLLDNG
jgi:hypothetical protein